jgi:hypothetical protein
MTSGRRIDPDIVAAIETGAAKGLGPAMILRGIERAMADREDLPDIRTVQRYVKQIRHGDAGDAWTLPPSAIGGSGFVLTALAEVIRQTRGRVRQITKGLAPWLESVHAVAPDLDAWTAYLVARMYSNRHEQGLPTADLDHFLAFAPWRSDQSARSYEAAVANGWIDPAPIAMNWASRVIVTAAALDSKKMPANVDPDIWDQLQQKRKGFGATP